MKKVITCLAILSTSILYGQTLIEKDLSKKGELTFDKQEVDVNETDEGHYTFNFVNTGDEPVIIERCNCPCGCYIVTHFPKEPIQPGESGVVKVCYDTKRIGPVNKVVYIVTNIPNSTDSRWGKVAYEFRMTGEVKAEDKIFVPIKKEIEFE